jgi:hypothetical protein
MLIRALLPLLLLCCAAARPTTAPSDHFLRTDALHTVHLKLTRPAWDQMQPTRRGGLAQLFAATRPATAEEPHESPFGYQYTYVHAAFECDGVALADVGLRFKGNSSYMTGQGVKKPFKLDFDRYAKGQSLAGLSGFNLHNNAMDPTLAREALSYQILRDAGVPAPRTAYALVYLTVDKLHERKLAGLYTIVEEVNKSFLRRHFSTADGLLLKPENAFNLPYRGDTFDKYEKIYRPKTEAPPELAQRWIDLTRLIHQADDATFDRDLESLLDVPSFLRFVATNALLGNMDSFLSTGHNFYVYVHPQTKRAHFLPWDLNLSLGTFDWVGTLKEQADLSLLHPYVKPNRLTERVLAIPRHRAAYLAEARRAADLVLSADAVKSRTATIKGVVAKAHELAQVPPRSLPPTAAPEADPETFLTRRRESVAAQLAGTSQGYAPYWQKMMFGGRAPRPATRPTTLPATAPAPEKR